MGGGTTMVGDPSGKDESRKMLTADDIEENKNGIKQVFSKFLDFDNDKAIMADNAEWLLELNYVEFLRDVGKHLSVNQMLARDSVKMRLEREQHLSFLEFNYMCRRMGTPSLYALTTPLLTTSSGAKMGKTADGAVWLSDSHLSAYDYWQYFRNSEDADVGRFMRLFTTLPLDEIARYEALEGAELNEAKKVLATETTAMVHGREVAEQAAETARRTFEEGQATDTLPTLSVSKSDFEEGIGLLSLIVEAGLASSNGEARRHVKGGAIRINDQQVSDERMSVSAEQLNDAGAVKLSMGKKKHFLIKPE